MLSRIWVPPSELDRYTPEQLCKLQLVLARMNVVIADVSARVVIGVERAVLCLHALSRLWQH